MKMGWAILIMFFIFIFGLPLMSYVNIINGHMHSKMMNCPECTIEAIEEKMAKLKAEHDKKLEENKKKLHDGTYKPRAWAGWPWNRENWNP